MAPHPANGTEGVQRHNDLTLPQVAKLASRAPLHSINESQHGSHVTTQDPYIRHASRHWQTVSCKGACLCHQLPHHHPCMAAARHECLSICTAIWYALGISTGASQPVQAHHSRCAFANHVRPSGPGSQGPHQTRRCLPSHRCGLQQRFQEPPCVPCPHSQCCTTGPVCLGPTCSASGAYHVNVPRMEMEERCVLSSITTASPACHLAMSGPC